jgi:CHASE2 domain-containing sensor protein
MTARHKKESRKHPGNAPPAPVAGASEEKRREGRNEIWISFFLSLAITAVLCGINWGVGDTEFGKQLEEMAYDILQNRLSSSAATANPGVIVLDISKIPMRLSQSLEPQSVTDRKPLGYLVDSLVKMSNPPKAIGLDVDFSPDAHGYADSDDQELFDSFLTANAKIPIRVGVHDSLALGKDRWLNDPKYIDLASCVVVPNPESVQTSWYMPEWLDVKYSSAPQDLPARCPAMAVALVNLVAKPVPRGFGWLAESTHQDANEKEVIAAPRFLVDYSELSNFENQRIVVPQIHSAEDAAKFVGDLDASKKLAGQIILLGRISNAGDIFIIPGRPVKPYPGVYLHASAAYTLLQDRPLYRLKFLGVLLLDALFSVLVFIPLLLIRFHRLNKGKQDFMDYGLAEILSFVVMAGLVAFAIWGVGKTHLMWDDFLIVAAAVIVHTPVEHAVERIGAALPAPVRSRFHNLLFSSRSHSEDAK